MSGCAEGWRENELKNNFRTEMRLRYFVLKYQILFASTHHALAKNPKAINIKVKNKPGQEIYGTMWKNELVHEIYC